MATGPIGVRVSNEVRVRFMGRLRLELCFNLTLTLIYIIKTKQTTQLFHPAAPANMHM